MRNKLDLSAYELAELVGVNARTVYRWEAAKSPRIEPFQVRLLAVLEQQTRVRPLALSEELRAAFTTGGGLLALHRLLQWVFGP